MECDNQVNNSKTILRDVLMYCFTHDVLENALLWKKMTFWTLSDDIESTLELLIIIRTVGGSNIECTGEQRMSCATGSTFQLFHRGLTIYEPGKQIIYAISNVDDYAFRNMVTRCQQGQTLWPSNHHLPQELCHRIPTKHCYQAIELSNRLTRCSVYLWIAFDQVA